MAALIAYKTEAFVHTQADIRDISLCEKLKSY